MNTPRPTVPVKYEIVSLEVDTYDEDGFLEYECYLRKLRSRNEGGYYMSAAPVPSVEEIYDSALMKAAKEVS